MQQPPSGEDPYEQCEPPKYLYSQQPLAPLQDPYIPPIQPYSTEIKLPAPPSQKKPPKRWTTAMIAALSFLVPICLCAIFTLIINRSAQPQAMTNDRSELVIVATMPPKQAITSNLIPATPATEPLEWVTTHTFEGNGNQMTQTFQIADTWKIVWSCGAGTTSENLIIDVHFSDGTMLHKAAINTICEIGNNNGETIEHQGGAIYLDVVSEGGWSVRIQEQQ